MKLTMNPRAAGAAAEPNGVATVWTVDDAKALRPDLDDEQAWTVLRLAAERFERDYGMKAECLKRCAMQLFGPPPGMTEALAASLQTVCRSADPRAAFDYQCFLADGRCVLVHAATGGHSVIRSTFTSDDVPHVVPLDGVPEDVYAVLERVVAE